MKNLPRPWQSLSEERKAQIAKVIAELLWRKRPANRLVETNHHAEQSR
jgi:hypothetical protein